MSAATALAVEPAADDIPTTTITVRDITVRAARLGILARPPVPYWIPSVERHPLLAVTWEPDPDTDAPEYAAAVAATGRDPLRRTS